MEGYERNPVPIFKTEWISKWPKCPVYNLCLSEICNRPDNPINWSCSDCVYYWEFAEERDIVVFKCSKVSRLRKLLEALKEEFKIRLIS